MIGLQITEEEYRKLPNPSYSLLSAISKEGPLAMYGVKNDISDLDSIIIGSITDSLVTQFKDPDNMVVVDKKPSTKALDIIKNICKRTDLVDTVNVLSLKNITQINEECISQGYYDGSTPDKKVGFLKKYNKYARAYAAYGDDIMLTSAYQYQTAKTLSNNILLRYQFLTDSNTIGQVKLLGNVKGVEFKGMLDFIYIDDTNKIIYPFDLKTGIGRHDEFFEKGFLTWNYFIQASLYKTILEEAKENTIYKDYTVENFRFLYCGRKDFLPIIYKVTDKWHIAGLEGFTYKDQEYKGVYDLIDEYQYYLGQPNSFYRKGYDTDEVLFDDNLIN